MQSTFICSEEPISETPPPRPAMALFPQPKALLSTVKSQRLGRAIFIYAVFFIVGVGLALQSHAPGWQNFGLGLVIPGGGLLAAGLHGFFALATMSFGFALLLWFATGNAFAPVAVWLATALIGLLLTSVNLAPVNLASANLMSANENLTPYALIIFPPCCGFVCLMVTLLQRRQGRQRRAWLNRQIAQHNQQRNQLPKQQTSGTLTAVLHSTHPQATELSPQDLARINLLLDRALQPVSSFQGFEFADQFQTAAVRYQINFMSYALAVVQAEYLPAFKGYLHQAQDQLTLKQQDPRMWRYWQLENIWGNFKFSADPIAQDNIMYSGFVAAQMAFRQSAAAYDRNSHRATLSCIASSGKQFNYSLAEIIERLAQQFESSQFGLLPCEPNWIYPLCNMITASAIRSHDALRAEDRWQSLAGNFSQQLNNEFITPGGQLVPFLSSYTGLAAPMVGGAVMQAFPCLFLNATLPDIAQRQWFALQNQIKKSGWRRALWPIDVGNYAFSRASSYAASAAAAREMGDDQSANDLLALLEQDCPAITQAGATHRPKASLWAHANEIIARYARCNSLQRLATEPKPTHGAYLKTASYDDVLVAQCTRQQRKLAMVFYPKQKAGVKHITVAGLLPGNNYQMLGNNAQKFVANQSGEAELALPVGGRTAVIIQPHS